MDTQYFLMHKNIFVALLSIDESGSAKLIRKITENEKHFPIGAKINNSKFSQWWRNRYIPEGRIGIKETLKNLGYPCVARALVDNLALSLTDCYWIKPSESNITWEEVNLFTNDFSDRIGENLFNPNKIIKKKKFDIGSSVGELKKKWIIDQKGNRLLIKGNTGLSFQQSLNEVFISSIHKELNPKYYLHYDLIELDNNGHNSLYCISPNFCNENTEFISALEIIDSKKLRGSDNIFCLFKQGCLEMGMREEEFNSYMDYLILTDYLFTNTDRHLRNLGILRNPDTLELIGFSPIFDNGNSMFYDKSFSDLNNNIDINNIKINSFYTTETKMIKNVNNFKVIDINNIHPDFSIYQKDNKENKKRYTLIQKIFNEKLDRIKKLQKKK